VNYFNPKVVASALAATVAGAAAGLLLAAQARYDTPKTLLTALGAAAAVGAASGLAGWVKDQGAWGATTLAPPVGIVAALATFEAAALATAAELRSVGSAVAPAAVPPGSLMAEPSAAFVPEEYFHTSLPADRFQTTTRTTWPPVPPTTPAP